MTLMCEVGELVFTDFLYAVQAVLSHSLSPTLSLSLSALKKKN